MLLILILKILCLECSNQISYIFTFISCEEMMKTGKLPRAEKLLKVGMYDLEKTLGKGNFAIVKLGVHRLTRTKVAVKIVNKCELDDENLNKISREIDIMRNLSHKNIIQLYQGKMKKEVEDHEFLVPS